jgi:hypothetical protein
MHCPLKQSQRPGIRIVSLGVKFGKVADVTGNVVAIWGCRDVKALEDTTESLFGGALTLNCIIVRPSPKPGK